MTTRHRPTMSRRLVAAIALASLLLTACGSGVTARTEERASEPAPAETAPVAADPPAGGHQYGATLDEWTEVEQEAQGAASADSDGDPDAFRSGYSEIEWADLIPPGSSGEELMARFEERLDAVEWGSPEADELWAEIEAEFDPAAVNDDLDGQQIRLAGFVAPLTYEDDIVTEFLLVPTFGACIHVPPPPPNQTVMVSVDKADGLSVDDTWGAVWVEGTLTIDPATTDLAAASYRISNATSGAYNDF